jgi:small subunit ribosomal protein S6
MTLPAPTYDLVLLLDPQAEEGTRTKILADARAAIEAQGEFLRHDDWGDRALTYPIDRKADAEYHLLQFHAGAPELLGALHRTLGITDGILRFRIIKLKPGVPDAPAVLAPQAVLEQPQTGVEPEVGAQPEAMVEAALETQAVVEGVIEADAADEGVVEGVLEADAADEGVVEGVLEADAADEAVVEGEGVAATETDRDGEVSEPA